ncbi:MAG: GNAT family N-acetyltransferase [Acidimicrobiales bacterium]
MELLADHPQLVAEVGEMRWREWGDEPGREGLSPWVDITAREAGRHAMPVSWVAVDEAGGAVGVVGLGRFDVEERRDRSPWVLGMVVRPAGRRQGVGRLLLDRLAEFAAELGYSQVWVATGGPAVGFYRRCGYEETERLPVSGGDEAVILTRRL